MLKDVFIYIMRLISVEQSFRHFKRHFSSTKGGRTEPGQYCLDLVKRLDHEHYLANLLLPSALRTAAFTLRAFSCEVAGIRDNVTDKTIGLVRVQFWKDAISGMYEDGTKVPQHPVAMELAKMVVKHKPSEQLLQNLAGSRDYFLSDKPFDSLEQVEQYGEKAFSSVYLVLLEIAGNTNGHVKHAATQFPALLGHPHHPVG